MDDYLSCDTAGRACKDDSLGTVVEEVVTARSRTITVEETCLPDLFYDCARVYDRFRRHVTSQGTKAECANKAHLLRAFGRHLQRERSDMPCAAYELPFELDITGKRLDAQLKAAQALFAWGCELFGWENPAYFGR